MMFQEITTEEEREKIKVELKKVADWMEEEASIDTVTSVSFTQTLVMKTFWYWTV